MSTLAPPRSGLAKEPPLEDPHSAGRFAQWRSSWAVALRMARRDVRRHKGRSALIVVMVLAPTLLLATIVILISTSEVSGLEKVPSTMGSGQAALSGPEFSTVAQSPDGIFYGSLGEEAPQPKPIPGFDTEQGAFGNADAIANLVGAPVAANSTFSLRTTVDDRRITLDGRALDGRIGLGEVLTLESGRWPEPPSADPDSPVEVLVTSLAVDRGLPGSGSFTADVEGETSTFEVVGTARTSSMYGPVGVIAAGAVGQEPPSYGDWIVLGDDPITWPEVLELNDFGLVVTSRAVLADPPPTSSLEPAVQSELNASAETYALAVGLATVMLLITTTLLAGPAFAVAAARQRRTLALVASNGAQTAMLRRTVMAQAVVLGVISAALGVALAVPVSYGIVLWDRTSEYPSLAGPFDPRPLPLLGVLVIASVSALTAALLPARRLGRLDIVGVMRGQSVSPRPSVAVFVTGLVLAAIGAVLTLSIVTPAALTSSILASAAELPIIGGAILLIVGSLLVVPMTLSGTGRIAAWLPTTLRMAARDLARHRARSAPSVAAILAVVAGLTFGLTGLASDTEQQRQQYLPTAVPGEVRVRAGLYPLDQAAVIAAAPTLIVTPDTVFTGDPTSSAQSEQPPSEPYRVDFVTVVPDGCTFEDSLGWLSDSPNGPRCAVAGSTSNGSGEVLVLPAAELARRLDLSSDQARQVADGAAVMLGGEGATARVVQGSYLFDPQAVELDASDVRAEREDTVPAVRLAVTKENTGRMLGATLAFAADTPLTQGWATAADGWSLRTEDGSAVPDATVERIQQALGDDPIIEVERGFQRDDRLIVAVLLVVFGLLILVVTLTSTALTLAEQHKDQATLAALGATRATRRAMAAAQAFALSALGCVLGAAVGLVPGIAIARVLTFRSCDPLSDQCSDGQGILVIPWLSVLIVAVAIPLVAAGLAAVGIRRAPQLTRRAS